MGELVSCLYGYLVERGVWFIVLGILPCWFFSMMLASSSKIKIVRRMSPDEGVILIITRSKSNAVIFLPGTILALEGLYQTMRVSVRTDSFVILLAVIITAFFTVFFFHKLIVAFSGIMVITNKNVYFTPHIFFWKTKVFPITDIQSYSLEPRVYSGPTLFMEVRNSEGVFFSDIKATKQIETKLSLMFVKYKEGSEKRDQTPEPNKPEKSGEQKNPQIPQIPPQDELPQKKTSW